jgi:D-3-phosphoglycerate dehydrogenase / 2-oxoglutarate reductase
MKKVSKILIGPSSFAALDKTPMELLISEGYEVIDNPFKRKLTREELLDLLSPDVIGLIAGLESLDREVLQQSNLEVISRVGTGLSNIDLDAVEDLGIKVCYTPYGPTTAVAELTIGALLSLIRMIPQMDRDLHLGKWNKRIGFQLEGKTVVIIGFGRIGKKVAELLSPFNSKILIVDPFSNEDIEDYTVLPLEKALPKADIIIIHSSGDECLLGADEFSLMKEGVYLLNVARGGLISESSLIKYLDNGRVMGAWLDTFENEPYDGPLKEYEQVILTPHIGSYTIECRKQMETEAVDNLINVIKESDKGER